MKICIISASPRLNSGFSVVAKNIAKGLKKLDHEIAYIGLQTAYTSEWCNGIEILPAQSFHIDDITQTMLTINKIKPDVVLAIIQMDADFNDFAKIFPKTVIYTPVEGRNIPQKMSNDLMSIKANGGEVVAQCKYGQEEMRLALAGIDIPYIYHGYDDKIFRPLDFKKDQINYCYYKTESGKTNSDPVILHKFGCYDCQFNKSEETKCPRYKEEQVAILKFINGKWGEESIPITNLPIITKGKFQFLFVGQNLGIRKRIERLLRAYYLFIKDSKQLKDRTVLHLHAMPISVNGVNLIKTIQDLGLQENIIFSYGSYRSSGWTDESMCILYNTADVNISASSSEGFCILPDSPIFTLGRGVQKIKDIKVGDKVLTHKGRFRKVSQTMKREFNGDVIKITSHKIGIPIVLTPEHRLLGIRTVPCTNKSGGIIKGKDICKPGQCYYIKNGIQYKRCKYIDGEEPYRRYKTEWICAADLEIGDFLTYPRANENIIDIDEIKIRDYIDDFLNVIGGEYSDGSKQSDLFGSFVEDTICMNANYSRKYAKIPAKIKLDEDLMKLFGYFIAEGDIAAERQIEFSFNINELEYIEDVERIMKEKFGLDTEHIIDKKINNEKINIHILRYSNKVLSNMFQNMFCPKEYIKRKGKGSKSNIVRIPPEILNLPLEKLAKLIQAEWRGDGTEFASSGGTYQITTTSETLAHQLLHILSRFGILASFRISDWNSKQNENWSIDYNIEIHGKDIEIFDEIIDQKNQYRNIKMDRDSRYLKGKNLYYTPIKDIEIIKYNGYVYNLEVEEDNSYVSSVVLHNCLPVLEGFATGLPMIAPACSSFVELIGDGEKDTENSRGLLATIGEWQMIENGSERALVNEQNLGIMMKKIYTDEKLRERFSKNAIKFSKNYTWDKICLQWNDLLKTMK